jgi:hypothetical protein
VAAVVGTGGIVYAAARDVNQDPLDEDEKTAVLVGGSAVWLGGLVMCVVSDQKYAKAGDVYNERITKTERRANEDRAYEDAESTK